MKQWVIYFLAIVHFQYGQVSAFPQFSYRASESANGRIVGGEEATPHEFPFVVRMLESSVYSCSAVIINKNHVLTSAGSCAASSLKTILAGAHDTANLDGTETWHNITERIEHPKYQSGISNYFDMAILRVSPSFEFNENIQPANITWAEDAVDLDYCTVCGWGSTSNIGGPLPTALRKVEVPFVPRSVCEYYFNQDPLAFDDHMVCYGDGQRSACRGNEGSPLICGGNVSGILSWNHPQACDRNPDVYTKLSGYKTFINLNTVNHQEDVRPMVRNSECGGLLDGTSGSIIIKNIEANVYCLWGIRMPLANGRFRVLSANLTHGANIYLTDRDGKSTKINDVGVDYDQPGPLYYITFWSGTSGAEGRFEVEFYGNGFGDPKDTLTAIDHVGGSSSGSYSYPEGGGNYSRLEDGVFLVQGVPGASLLFPEFDLEQSTLCENDKLAVYSWGTNSFLLRTVNCGTTAPLPLRSTSGLFLVHFTSNFNRYAGRGFTLSWVP